MKMGRFEVLDGMRGVAALCILFYHYGASPDSRPLFGNGFMAVDFFFILSGFVIAHAYGARFMNYQISVYAFLCKRLIRLYPMFLVGLAGGIAVNAYAIEYLNVDYPLHDLMVGSICNLFFLPYLTGTGEHILFPANMVLWSLFFELFVNAFCPLLLTCSTRNLWKVVVIAFLAMVLSGFIRHAGHGGAFVPWGGWETGNFLNGFCRVFYGFALGVLLYRIKADALPEPIAFLKNLPFLPCIFLTIALAIPFVSGAYYLMVVAIIAPVCVLWGAALLCRNTISLNIMRFLGWISYPVYCLQLPVYVAMSIVLGQTMAAYMALIATLGLSVLLARFYDDPVRACLSRKLQAYGLSRE